MLSLESSTWLIAAFYMGGISLPRLVAFHRAWVSGEVSRWSGKDGCRDRKGKPFSKESQVWGIGMVGSQMHGLIYRHLYKKENMENEGKLGYSEEKLPRQAFKTLF